MFLFSPNQEIWYIQNLGLARLSVHANMFGLHFFLLLSLFEWKDFLKYPSNMFFVVTKNKPPICFTAEKL